MTTLRTREEIARQIESEWKMGGLSSGIYFDFAMEVHKRLRLQDLQVIMEMIKKNTAENKYRDGETAFDIVQDINKLL